MHTGGIEAVLAQRRLDAPPNLIIGVGEGEKGMATGFEDAGGVSTEALCWKNSIHGVTVASRMAMISVIRVIRLVKTRSLADSQPQNGPNRWKMSSP
jgi:hypothetical protein